MNENKLLKLFEDRLSQSKFYQYRPYGHPDTLCPDGELWKEMGWEPWSNKPWQLDFHQSGKENTERAGICANGTGKSYETLWETTAHLLGEYPDWYDGYRFDHPVIWWVGSIDASLQTESVQPILLGENLTDELGTGFIPRDRIRGKPSLKQSGVPDTVHKVRIEHSSGKTSTLIFKTYAQGWKSWQSGKPDGITLDEQPDDEDNKQKRIFEECQTRIFRSGGIMLAGLTPLLGETELTRHFMYPKASRIKCFYATWDDAAHLKDEDKQRLLKTYSDHVVESRTLGVPMMGEGKVIAVSEADIKCQPFELPKHYARICGVDFGVAKGHPTAAVWLAWDRDRDIVYLYDEYRKEQDDAIYHAESIKQRGVWIPVSWPHDGHQTSDLTKAKADGNELKDIYLGYGLNMLGRSARYNNDTGGSQPVEPIIDTLIQRMKTGRFYVFSNLHYFFEEMRSFHRKDGKIVNRREDTIKAVLYGLMMLRYAHPEPHNIPIRAQTRGFSIHGH